MNRFVATLIALPIAVATLAGCPTTEETPSITPDTLEPPAQGQGFQFKTELFSVDPGTEVQDCYFFQIRDLAKRGGLDENAPVNLHRVRMVQRDGSHHMNLFRVKTIKGLGPAGGAIQRGLNAQGECFKSPNWSDWPLVANSQVDGDVDWTFPDGVANVFQPDEWLMLQTHYVNATSQKTPEKGEVAVNFHTIPAVEVKHQLGTLFATKQSIRVCKGNPTPEFSGTCQIKSQQPVNIVGANGHFHGRGKAFEMFSWDGTSIAKPDESARFYQSTSWDEPPMLRSPQLDKQLAPMGGVYFTCSYQWQPPTAEAGGCEALDAYDKNPQKDCCYTFGPQVERNEHCNIFVYYWPKVDDIACN